MLVAILIYWPGLVTDFVPRHQSIDPAGVEIKLDERDREGQGIPSPSAKGSSSTAETPSEEDAAAEIQRQFKSGR